MHALLVFVLAISSNLRNFYNFLLGIYGYQTLYFYRLYGIRHRRKYAIPISISVPEKSQKNLKEYNDLYVIGALRNVYGDD